MQLGYFEDKLWVQQKNWKQGVLRDLSGLICTQKIKMEALKNSLVIII